MPSPWAALTSSPLFKSVRIASRLPFIAASATGDGPAATRMADRHTAPAMLKQKPVSNVRRMVLFPRECGFDCLVQIQRAGAVAKVVQVVDTELVQHAQERVRHRRTVRRLDVETAAQLAAHLADEEERTL